MAEMFVKLTQEDKDEIKDNDRSDLLTILVDNLGYLTSFQIGDVVRINNIDCDYDSNDNGISISPRTQTIVADNRINAYVEIPALYQVVALEKNKLPIVKMIRHPMNVDPEYEEDEEYEILFFQDLMNYLQSDIDDIANKYLIGVFQKMIFMDSAFADSTILGSEFIPYEGEDVKQAMDEVLKQQVDNYFRQKDAREASKLRFKTKEEVIAWMITLKKGDEYWDYKTEESRTVLKKYCPRFGEHYGLKVAEDYYSKYLIDPETLVGKIILKDEPDWMPAKPSVELITRFAPHRLPKIRAKKKVATKKKVK